MKMLNVTKLTTVLYFCVTFCTGINTRRSHNDEDLEEATSNITSRKLGQIRFEDSRISGTVEPYYMTTSNRFKFEDDAISYGENNPGDDAINYGDTNSGRITFLDDNKIEFDRPVNNNNDIKLESSGTKKKKRRRRRPRVQRPPNGVGPFPPGPQYPAGLAPVGPYPGISGAVPPYPGIPGVIMPYPGIQGTVLPYPGIPGAIPPYPGIQGTVPTYPGIPGAAPPYPGFGPGGDPGQYYRPPHRPKPSFASEALTAVTGALSSIAQYDDYQCVPRLLCEAAGGGALGSSGVLQSVAGLQPLLTLLAAYNGISGSPLFVFGRAVFLGMTAKGNTASCRYAYPQCPTDPEQLVHYLNNHNGGFFRFFNTPQQNPQNLDQFYQQLSLQGQYGLQNQNFGNPNNPFVQNQQPDQFYQQGQQNLQNYALNPQSNQQGYGFQQFPSGNQNYGLYRPQVNQYPQQNYGLQNPQFQNLQPNLSQNNGYGYIQNYGKKYPYSNKYGLNNIKFKDNGRAKNEIQRRIQNKPNYQATYDSNIENDYSDQSFKFPDDDRKGEEDVNNTRDGKALKFPEENVNANPNDIMNNRKAKAITFPEAYNVQDDIVYSNKITNQYLRFPNLNIRDTALDSYIKYYNYYHGNAVNTNEHKYNNVNREEGVETVYVVRGNGDPNNPEIVKIRQGEQVKL